ncbi:MAG: nitroreductase family deazaflavin-dependent oxidoreductase [Rubrobacter sp.]|nr:nitroreductase family deazaflavin-dependent oxidoreductase [Rubrobacter sp.]
MKSREAGRFRRVVRDLSGPKAVSRVLARTLHHADRFVFEATNGRRTASSLLTGLPIVMLTTTGAKSGKKRTLPLLGILDGEDIIVVASGYGQTKYPAWYHNLRANPDALAQVRGQRHRVTAGEAEGAERARLWRFCLEVYPALAAYEEWAGDRRIPVIVLARK